MHTAYYGVIGVTSRNRGCRLVWYQGMVYNKDCENDLDGQVNQNRYNIKNADNRYGSYVYEKNLLQSWISGI